MAAYLLIESRDPFESNDVAHYYELASRLARNGEEVTLFLVQNGVFPVRHSTWSKALTDLAESGVRVLADEFSLRERGIRPEKLVPGVEASPLATVVERLAAGDKALWH